MLNIVVGRICFRETEVYLVIEVSKVTQEHPANRVTWSVPYKYNHVS